MNEPRTSPERVFPRAPKRTLLAENKLGTYSPLPRKQWDLQNLCVKSLSVLCFSCGSAFWSSLLVSALSRIGTIIDTRSQYYWASITGIKSRSTDRTCNCICLWRKILGNCAGLIAFLGSQVLCRQIHWTQYHFGTEGTWMRRFWRNPRKEIAAEVRNALRVPFCLYK